MTRTGQPGGNDLAACDSNADALSIFVVDVGQGDATLVIGPSNGERPTALLIDAGDRWPDGGAIVRELLDSLGVTMRDQVVVSHFDDDRIGGGS